MPLDLADIRKLKTELRRDLEALERTEAIIIRTSNNNGASKHATASAVETSDNKPSLRGTIMAVLERSVKGLRPTEIVQLVIDRGYPFPSPRKGMGSVTKVLFREQGKSVEKLKDGTYVLKR
jgi:hypothetical protein